MFNSSGSGYGGKEPLPHGKFHRQNDGTGIGEKFGVSMEDVPLFGQAAFSLQGVPDGGVGSQETAEAVERLLIDGDTGKAPVLRFSRVDGNAADKGPPP